MKSSITFAGITVESGQKVQTYVEVPGLNYKMPVTIINGVEDGKKFFISASIHGFEYPGIQSCVELQNEIQPKDVSGAVIIIPLVNLSGFYGRLPYVCADDEERKNLNKIGEGDPNGTFAEKLMYFFHHEFTAQMDFHIDLHSGDATEGLYNFAAAGNSDDPEILAFEHDSIMHTSWEYRTKSGGRNEVYNTSTRLFHIPSMMFEVGGAGVWTREQVDEEKSNLVRLMQYCKVLPGEPALNENQIWLQKQAWIECECDGCFYAFCKVGDIITKGQKIAEIRDIFGELKSEIFCEYDKARVMILNNTLGVSAGDDAVFYGALD